jgi:hypothetical protein
VNFTSSANPGITSSTGPRLVVKTLKYEQYPVNAGDWFDIWVKVENIGQASAQDVQFTLAPEYPFSMSDNGTQYYGTLSGTAQAYKERLPAEADIESNQVILKYRVKVAESASEGTHLLKLRVESRQSASGSLNEQTYELPITVEKTKTDLAITMQESNVLRTSFALVNTGDKPASAVTVSLAGDNPPAVRGPATVVVGTLGPGDFINVPFQLVPNSSVHAMTLQIDYTDIAGNRNTLLRTVPVALAAEPVQETKIPEPFYASAWLYAVAGLIVGMGVALLLSRRKV